MVTDEERLYELIPRLMINFKYAIVCEELKHTLFALQNPAIANDETQCNSIMERYNTLTAAERTQFLALCRRYNAALRQALSTAIGEKKE